MRKGIHDVVGAKVVVVKRIYVNGVFDFWDFSTDRFSLGIYNPVFYRVSGRENEELDDQHLHDLIGREITGLFILDDQRLEFTLDDSSVFTISLRTEDFIGPEAAEIHFDTGEIIIFN